MVGSDRLAEDEASRDISVVLTYGGVGVGVGDMARPVDTGIASF